MQSRITHNHLSVVNGGGRAVYIDSSFAVILIELDPDKLLPSFKTVFELPRSISTSTSNYHAEYPRAVFASPDTLVVSDGHGSLYTLVGVSTGDVRCVGMGYLDVESSSPVPFKLHSCAETASGNVIAIVSRCRYGNKPVSVKDKLQVTFDVLAARVPISPLGASSSSSLDILWRVHGDGVPVYAVYDKRSSFYLLAGSGEYRGYQDSTPEPDYQPSPDEIAPIPRAGENLDVVAMPPPPYSWTQTSDSVTIALPLPSQTVKSDITVAFSPTELTVHIKSTEPTTLPLPHYALKRLWDGISPSTSYWTWDREAEHTYGILSLHLDKQHEGVKWQHVFAAAGRGPNAELAAEDVDVPETLDPSELYAIREALEKYTSALRTGEDLSGLGLGRGVPSLGDGEIDEEADASVGRPVVVTWLNEQGVRQRRRDQPDVPSVLLSVPMPCSDPLVPSLVIKRDLDGVLFTVDPSPEAPVPRWTHSGTFSALAFVLASKQDTRFTYHVSGTAVVALESGGRERGANAYVYHGVDTLSQLWAKQSVVSIGAGGIGAAPLLGAGMLSIGQPNEYVLLCLTERQIAVAKEVI
ncbi:hypothetical protein FISHEDRAFT_76459 [Fistulina hepatica ATCC 64428]|uniref:NudC domain-containing protein 1 n=1 Tax=Fistulina hepatica ATCC 64428 TaxID=1128425 RepID=A0A0D7A473_9AGAR|nr:hypothetical protein FISHEDRAFT_76459 [Fistulina hepatica ATCC 64428]